MVLPDTARLRTCDVKRMAVPVPGKEETEAELSVFGHSNNNNSDNAHDRRFGEIFVVFFCCGRSVIYSLVFLTSC